MNANERQSSAGLLLKDEVYQVVGCAMEVLNAIGHGFHEKIYENGLAAEFEETGVPYSRQSRFEVCYKGRTLGQYIPDLIAYDGLIVEIKTIDRIGAAERGQLLNYLKVTGCKVGVILNFKNPKLEWERLVLS